ncbi:hypothetical protein Gotur_021610 [Gossypium turneri]
MCRQVVEDLDNVFLHCLFAIIIWKDVGIVPGIWFYRNMAIWKQKIMIADHLMHYVDEFCKDEWKLDWFMLFNWFLKY